MQFSVANERGGGRASPVHCSRCPSGLSHLDSGGAGQCPGALLRAERPRDWHLVSGEVSPESQSWSRAGRESSPRQGDNGPGASAGSPVGGGASGALSPSRGPQLSRFRRPVGSATGHGLFSLAVSSVYIQPWAQSLDWKAQWTTSRAAHFTDGETELQRGRGLPQVRQQIN